MTPEQVEARFQRIEALLAQTAEQNAERDRRLAEQNAERDRRLAEQNAERDGRIEDLEEQMQIMVVGINRLVESSIEYSRWKLDVDRYMRESNQRIEESNQRFNVLLEEIRAVSGRVAILENH
jgi:hypothetical protein